MLDRPLRLSVNALARVVRAEGLGQLHVTIAPAALWFPRDEEARADAAAREELAQAGGLDRRGRVDADIAAALGMLCAPRAEFYGWVSHAAKTIGVLVAVTGRNAVLVVRDEGVVTIVRADPDAPADALVAQTPDVLPGRGRAITVLTEDIRGCVDGRQRTAAGVGTRQAPPDVLAVQRISELPTTGGGQLYAAVRDNAGRRHPVAQPVRYADTVHGRWLNLTLPGDRVLVAPADRQALSARVHDLHRALSRP
ncbi:ESX secretion-associated protein EspG [Actinokineospora sp. 24-640]